MKNKTAFLPIRVSVFNCGFPNEQIRFGKAIYLLPVPIGSLLFVLLASTLGGSAPGWWHAPMLLSNGSLGCCPPQAWHRDSKWPCPLPGLMKNRQVDMTKIKSLLQKRQTSLCPGHEWLAIFVLWFHWSVFIRSDRASDWSYQESTSYHMRKKVFCVP